MVLRLVPGQALRAREAFDAVSREEQGEGALSPLGGK